MLPIVPVMQMLFLHNVSLNVKDFLENAIIQEHWMFYLVPLNHADEAEQRIFGDLCLNADSLKVVVLFVLSE